MSIVEKNEFQNRVFLFSNFLGATILNNCDVKWLPFRYKTKALCLITKGQPRQVEAACEQKICILDPGSVFIDYYLHRVRSLEEKLEDLASLSLNYWLTKFVQEIANKNEIVNSARGMFTELKKKRNWQCS